jgi:hypothetical protein
MGAAAGAIGEQPPDTSGRTTSSTRLDGVPLRVVRLAWLALTALSVALTLAGLRIYVAALHTVCTRTACPSVQLAPEGARALAHLSVSLTTYAAVVTVDTLLVVLVFCAVAAMLAWRRSDDWLALLVSYMLVATGTALIFGYVAVPATWWFLDQVVSFLGYAPAVFLVFYLFPDGSFRPRWLLWAILVATAIEAGNNLAPGSVLDVDHWVPNLENFCYFGLLAALAGAQVYRYRRVYSPIQRQQSKLVIFSIAVFGGFGLVVYALGPGLANVAHLNVALLSVVGPLVFVNVFALSIPMSFAVAILRYRLWDIDLLINRTLVYTALTALLALVYGVVVLALQAPAAALTGQQKSQPFAIVTSTLLVAALVTPLRRRLQAIIDRRFYRRKYEAGRTLATFAASLHSELEISQLADNLRQVVEQTMQPAHISLWLQTPSPVRAEATASEQLTPGSAARTRQPNDDPLFLQAT